MKIKFTLKKKGAFGRITISFSKKLNLRVFHRRLQTSVSLVNILSFVT